jgi:serine protease inhibitor
MEGTMLRREHERKVGALGAFSPPAVVQAKEENTPVDPAIVSADNTFGLNLLNTLMQGNSGNNTAIAPLSVAIALQIAYNGAVGTTQQAMAQTLWLGDLTVPQLNGDNAALQASLLDPDPKVDFHRQFTVGSSRRPPCGFDLPQWQLPAQADYSGIVAILVNAIYFKFISDVEHKTVVEVNETGTVAVGVTGVGIGTTPMPESVNLAINHPFFYAIRDNTSGDLLFVGVLMNPGAG